MVVVKSRSMVKVFVCQETKSFGKVNSSQVLVKYISSPGMETGTIAVPAVLQ
jgi:hypothetical protein